MLWKSQMIDPVKVSPYSYAFSLRSPEAISSSEGIVILRPLFFCPGILNSVWL